MLSPTSLVGSLFRAASIGVALAVGWVVYMVAMVTSTYDGCLSLFLQPLMAIICSGLFVTIAVFAGLLLRLPIGRFWRATPLWASLLSVASLSGLLLGKSLGFTSMGFNPELGTSVQTLHPALAIACYFLLLFSVANWPVPGFIRLGSSAKKPAEAHVT